MTAVEAFKQFAKHVLTPSKAERFATLASSKKGQHKILNDLCHRFESVVRKSAIQRRDRRSFENLACFAFHASCGFGASYPTVSEAYEALSVDDGWLILVADGSVGFIAPSRDGMMRSSFRHKISAGRPIDLRDISLLERPS
jgi:hypothetical protein